MASNSHDMRRDNIAPPESSELQTPQAPYAPHDMPALPRPRMPLSQRAKIFIPFDPLKGYREALREKEIEAEALYETPGAHDHGLDASWEE